MISQGQRGIWQRRYREHTIRDEQDFATHFDYIHFNPVKHGLVEHPGEWPHSFFRRCVGGGLYQAGWMRSAGEPPETGERRCVETAKAGAGGTYHSRPSLLGTARYADDS
jgi:hypothetical protein